MIMKKSFDEKTKKLPEELVEKKTHELYSDLITPETFALEKS